MDDLDTVDSTMDAISSTSIPPHIPSSSNTAHRHAPCYSTKGAFNISENTMDNAPQGPPLTTFAKWRAILKDSDVWALEVLKIKDEGANVADAIRQGTSRAVSDGSYKDGSATSAFTIHGNSPTKRITGCKAVPSIKRIGEN